MFASSYQIGRVFGVPIRVHVTLIILLPVLALQIEHAMGFDSFGWGLVAVVAFFACVAMHELGHTLIAMQRGCRTREIILLPIGGLAQLECMPRNPRDELHVAAAGPLVSFALAGASWLLASFLMRLGMVRPAVVASMLGSVNFTLAIFNLLPSFPMDGGRIFRAWLTPKIGRLLATRIAAKLGRFLAILFGVYGLYTGNFILILIALFIYQAAGAEYRMVRIQEASRTSQSGPWVSVGEEQWPTDDEEIVVGPPPYKQSGVQYRMFVRPLRAQHDLFNDLFEKWRT